MDYLTLNIFESSQEHERIIEDLRQHIQETSSWIVKVMWVLKRDCNPKDLRRDEDEEMKIRWDETFFSKI